MDSNNEVSWSDALWFVWGLVAPPVALGFVIHDLWGWFITPAFGIVQVSIGNSVGIVLLVKAILYKDSDRGRIAEKYQISRTLALYWSYWAIGLIISRWM